MIFPPLKPENVARSIADGFPRYYNCLKVRAWVAEMEEFTRFRKLRYEVLRAEKNKVRLNLPDLGVTAANFAPEYLLATVAHPCLNAYYPVLQLLTEHGYLPQIPAELLTPRVVLYRCHYPTNSTTSPISKRPLSFLAFCARYGYYRELPGRYQTRTVLRHGGRYRGPQCPSPQFLASKYGQLHNFPVERLNPNDIRCTNVRYAIVHEQLEIIKQMVQPQEITFTGLIAFLQHGDDSGCIQKHFHADKLLEVSLGHNALTYAACLGLLDKIPVQLFVNHLRQASQSIDYLSKNISSVVRNKRRARKLMRSARTWLARVGQEILSRKARQRGQP